MLISIVIVEYKSPDEIRRCIAAIADKLTVPYEVIVSSNSSYSETERADILRQAKGERWIFNERNGGFAYAMNCGLRQANGDFLVIMNSDCVLGGDLGQMARFLHDHPQVGAAGPQFVDADGNIQDSARPYVTPCRFIGRFIRRKREKTVCVMEAGMDYSRVQTVDWVIGAFIMVSRRAYELTGGLDDGFFMYAEDVDWCTRIRQQGLEIVYFPPTRIEYKGTRRARNSRKYTAIFIKSHLRYWRKFGFFFGYPRRRQLDF